MNKFVRFSSLCIAASVLFCACSFSNDSKGSSSSREDGSYEDLKNGSESKNDVFNVSLDYNAALDAEFDAQTLSDLYNNYSFEFVNEVMESESSDTNVMVSPASVMFALDMCSAGANGNTLEQIAELLSPGVEISSQHAFASSMLRRMNDSSYVDFSCANAVWSNSNRMSTGLNPDFEEYINEIFDAGATAEPFSSSTISEINSWVSEHTDGMIDQVLNQLAPDTVAVLINAICFEGQWMEPYDEYQLAQEVFTTSSGGTLSLDMLSGTEGVYFEDNKAIGFLKYYEGGEYALLVMLPTDESISANEFLSEFTGSDYARFTGSLTYDYDVYTLIPEFDYDYDISLNSVLISLGMTDAFAEDRADFQGIGIADSGGNIYISDVIHKTHIELDRNGTRAAAATAVIMNDQAAFMDERETRSVICDRPFAYAIVDAVSMNPVFIGTFNG